MNLIIDIGNTLTKIAVFDEDTLVNVSMSQGQCPETLHSVLSEYAVKSVIIASVTELLPSISGILNDLEIPLLFLNSNTPLPIKNLYKSPDTLGYDRIAAAIGANQQYPDRNMLIIDLGTAITFEFVDSENQYHGGNISPGLDMRLKALNHYTGKLPLVKKDGDLPYLGDTTETAIRAGVFKGIEFEINGYITSLKHKYPELLVFLTGGNANSFAANLKNIIFADSFLVLKGLNTILKYNNGRI